MRPWIKWLISYAAVALTGGLTYLLFPESLGIPPELLFGGIGVIGFIVAKTWVESTESKAQRKQNH